MTWDGRGQEKAIMHTAHSPTSDNEIDTNNTTVSSAEETVNSQVYLLPFYNATATATVTISHKQ